MNFRDLFNDNTRSGSCHVVPAAEALRLGLLTLVASRRKSESQTKQYQARWDKFPLSTPSDDAFTESIMCQERIVRQRPTCGH